MRCLMNEYYLCNLTFYLVIIVSYSGTPIAADMVLT
jgi:hypothetical protein